MQLKDLKPNPKNPRTITNEKLSMLRKALEEFGDLGGFVFNRKTRQLVGGHQRAKLFNKDTPVTLDKEYKKPTKTGTVAEGYVELKGERFRYREVEWDEIKEKAANIAANKGAGEWDMPQLSEWMTEIDEFGFDLDLTMFDEAERLRAMVEIKKVEADEAKDNAVPKLPKTAKTKVGGLYALGNHRLLCGDSTKLDDYELLFGKERADITFTSPPYNGNTSQQVQTSIQSKTGKSTARALYAEYDDNKPSDEYVEFAAKILGNCIKYTKEYVFWNVNYNSKSRFEFLKQIIPFLPILDETICWYKKNAAPFAYGLTRIWEPIFVFRCHKDARRISSNETHDTEFNVWEISPFGASCEEHSAAFPVALPERALNLVKTAGSLFDPFGGSGTSMIACEKLGQKCFMIELSPLYCDLIVTRWEEYTGKKATLISDKKSNKK